jgi:bacterioferritin
MAKNKNREKVIEMLNEARASELTAILQYMAHHYELEDADFGGLARILKATAIAEMKHAEALAERILFLCGQPVTKPDQQVRRGMKIGDLLDADVALEEGAVVMYNHHAVACAEAGDQVSKDLFEKLLADEEGHLDEFQNLRDHVKELGAAFLATLTGEGE